MSKGRKIHQLHGPTRPKTFAGMLVEKADQIVDIACVIHWKDGSTNVSSTSMSLGDAAWLDYVFRKDFMAELTVTCTIDKDDGSAG